MLGKPVVLKVLEDFHKSLVELLLKNSSCPIYHLRITMQKIYYTTNVSCECECSMNFGDEFLWILAGRVSVVVLLLSKETGEIYAFCYSAEKSIPCIGMFQVVALLEISRNSLVGLDSTGYKANKFLIKFLEGDLKISKHFQEELCIGVLFQ